MNKNFYNKVKNDLKTLEIRKVDNTPITKAELNKFRKDALNMLEVVNGTKEYDEVFKPVTMSAQKGFKTTKHEVLLNAIIDRINELQVK